MTDIPYDAYIKLITLAAGDLSGQKILDVGCGTGVLSAKLAEIGGEVTGIDLSAEMLQMAKERAELLQLPMTFIQQPMQELAGHQQMDVAVISIDSLNYLMEKSEVKETFNRIYEALKPGGILLFDVHSTFKMDVIFMEGPFVFDDKEIAYIWQTAPSDVPHSIHSVLSFFVKTETGLYERFDETHRQRTFPVHEYVEMLMETGFQLERIFADWEDEAPEEESERIFFQVRK